MRLFSCKVLLGGSRYNEVFKDEVTIPEIVVLRHIHKSKEGHDAVTEIKFLGSQVARTDEQERARLQSLYDPRNKFLDSKLFGVAIPLPQVLPGVDVGAVTKPARRTREAEPVDEAAALNG